MAKQRIRVLTDSSVIELQRMQTRLTNLERKQLPLGHSVEAKSVYIVQTPSGGIPAATVGVERTPGSAVCIMHRRLNNTSNASRVDTINSNVTVYNFTDVEIPGSSYVLAFRDAWGDLWAVPGGSTCPDLPSPGSYPAVAGAAIAAAASGVVVYDGEVYTATNQSECAVRVGDLVGLHVSPSCEVFFVPCVCNCNAGPHDCCDKSIALCVNGYTKILKVDGGSAEWTITECCECDSTAILTISLTCTGNTVTASWDYECGATTSSGTFDLSGLCDDPIVEYDDTITMSGCPVRIIATENAEACAECSEPAPDCTCCFELDAFSVGANCDKSDVPATVDDAGLTAVASATDPVCNGQTTVVTLTFTNSTGGDYGGGADPIQVDLTSTAPTKPTCTAASDSGSITNNASGFVVEWAMPGTWANGTTITRTFTMQNNGCTVGVSTASANVSAGRGYICQISWTAVACP